jgi:hypothetical protein
MNVTVSAKKINEARDKLTPVPAMTAIGTAIGLSTVRGWHLCTEEESHIHPVHAANLAKFLKCKVKDIEAGGVI